ncbi:FtsX-like permease family protein [Hydrogenimonas sp. SS33]|uniref:FtsX-like permease family protein n=1 Tax=Hydrogenimonas leucolamina TaxID=2954236 RepID=UPI00336BD743
MTFIRNHLGLILPLFAILFSLEYLLVFDRVVHTYENRLKEQFTVIVVADRGVDPVALKNASVLVGSVEKVDAAAVLKRLRRQISEANLEKLKAVLPVFYTVKLRRYPDSKRLEKLKEELTGVKGVRRVQVFENVHDRIYGMLIFMKSNFYVFATLIALIGSLLILKQMVVWQLEHSERMQIMALFGAPVWLRSGVLFRLAFVDALIALLLAAGLMFYLTGESHVLTILQEMHIDPATLLHLDDLTLLAATAFGLSLFSALWVVMRFKEEI